MSVVGAFPGWMNLNKQTMRGPTNPLDVSTVISIFPKEIIETKVTLFPGVFHLTPGSYLNPSRLVVGPSSWWKDVGEEQPLLEIPVSSIQIAKSIVDDYSNGILGCDMGEAQPGLFFIPGEIEIKELLSKHRPQLDRAAQRQRNWYTTLVKLADALWSRSNGNPLAISDDMRLAARELSFNNKEWLADFQHVEMARCIACGSMRNPLYPVCPTCKAVVDPEMAKKLNLKFVE